MFRSLVDAEIVEQLAEPDDLDRMVRVHVDLQDNFALNQPLSLFAVEVLELLDPDDPGHALDTLSVIESVLENPAVILARQLDHAKTELITELKSDGVEYDERTAPARRGHLASAEPRDALGRVHRVGNTSSVGRR